MSLDQALQIMHYLRIVVSSIIYLVTLSILIFRIYSILKKMYIDWTLLISCFISMIYLILVAIYVIATNTEIYRTSYVAWMLIVNFGLALKYTFWLMIISYPAVLIIYCTKLNQLRKGKLLKEIKKQINCRELFLIISIFIFFIVYLIILNTLTIMVYQNEWIISEDEIQDDTRICKVLLKIQYIRGYLDIVFWLFLSIIHIIVYCLLK